MPKVQGLARRGGGAKGACVVVAALLWLQLGLCT